MTSVQTQDILLRRVEPNALKALIEYLYTGKLTITSDNVVPLLKAGHRFGCPFVARATGAVLDEICQLNLNSEKTQNGLNYNSDSNNTHKQHSNNNHRNNKQKNNGSLIISSYSDSLGVQTLGNVNPDNIITIDNWLDVYRLSSIYNLTLLRECVKHYIAKDFYKLSQSPAFKEARMQDIVFFSNSESIRVALIGLNIHQDISTESEAELKLFRALLNWILHKPDERTQHISKIMSTIKFQNIKPSDLKRHVMTEMVIMEEPSVKDKITLAYQRQHAIHGAGVGEDAIIAIGGLEISEETSTLETSDKIYWLNLEAQSWPEYATLPDKRRCHSCGVIKNKLYIIGGEDETGKLLNSGYRYDITKNDWMILPNLNERRVNAQLATWAGSVFIIGGQTSPMKMANSGNEAANFIQNYNNRQLLGTIEVLDEKRRKWKRIGREHGNGEFAGLLPKPNYNHAVCGAQGHGIFISGGESNPYEFALIKIDDVDDSQILAGSFTSHQRNSARYIPYANHRVAHSGHQMHYIRNKLYLIDSRNPPSQTCSVFNIMTEQWTELHSFTPVPRSYTSSAHLGDVIYMLGSSEEQNSLTQSLQAYDTDSQDWLQMSGLPPSCKDFQLCVIKIPMATGELGND